MNQSCANCRYWKRTKWFSTSEPDDWPSESDDWRWGDSGKCRRRSPVIYQKWGSAAVFPETLESDWCGEYEPDPEATA